MISICPTTGHSNVSPKASACLFSKPRVNVPALWSLELAAVLRKVGVACAVDALRRVVVAGSRCAVLPYRSAKAIQLPYLPSTNAIQMLRTIKFKLTRSQRAPCALLQC